MIALLRTALRAGQLRTELTADQMEDLLTHVEKCWWNIKIISALPGCTISYDANGNPLQDCARGGQDIYTWDAEGKARTLDDVTVVYDALGRGVERKATVNPTLYTPIVYTPGGQKLASLVVYPGNSSYYVYRAFVPLPAGAVAVYGNYTNSILFYRHPDWLGSGRLETNPTGTGMDRIYQDVAYAPYGEDYVKLGAPYDLSFTGQTQDEISATYDFMFRDYSAISGRWYSPDPAGQAAASPANPQSWNRYAYVGNNPLSFVDPLGLCPLWEPDKTTPLFCAIPKPVPFPPDPGGGPPPSGGGGGATHGPWENGETLGLPTGMNLKPASILELLGLAPAAPGTGCDFGVCNSIGSGFSADSIALAGLGTAARAIGQLARFAGVVGILLQTVVMTGDGRPFDPAHPERSLPDDVAIRLAACGKGRLVVEPATGNRYIGGTSYEQEYICVSGPWTIHWIIKNDVIVHGPHIRPGSPKGGSAP